MTAPIRTPRSSPEPSTPSSAAMAVMNSVRSARHSRRSASTWNSPATATSTTAASTGCGRLRSGPDEEDRDEQDDQRRDQPRERRAGAAALVDERLRHPAADREALAQTGREVGAAASASSSWLLSSRPPCLAANIRPIATVSTAPSRKHASASGSRSFTSSQPTAGSRRSRQAARHLAEHLHAAHVEAEDRSGDDPADHDEQRDRPVFQEHLAGDEHARARSVRAASDVGFVSCRWREEVPAAFPEAAAVRRRRSRRAWAAACWPGTVRRRT